MTSEIQTVVSLDKYRNRPTHSVLLQVEAYWDSIRQDRLVPARADVDPRGIEQALEYAFVLERVAKGLARFRLAGMHLNDLMGMEVRGMPLTAMILPNSRPLVSGAMEAVFDEPAISRMTLRSAPAMGRPALEAQLLLLPLRSDLGDVSRVLGCLVADGDIGRAPRRFDVVEQNRSTLVGYGDVRPVPAAEPTFAASAPDLVQPKPKRAPHLTLVKSDA